MRLSRLKGGNVDQKRLLRILMDILMMNKNILKAINGKSSHLALAKGQWQRLSEVVAKLYEEEK